MSEEEKLAPGPQKSQEATEVQERQEFPEAEETPGEERASPPPLRHSVFPYLAILFGVAFLLLLFAYLMQQRDSEEIIGNLSDLRESMGSIQSIDELVEENRALRGELDDLKGQVAELDSARRLQNNELSALEEKLSACEDLAASRLTQIEDAQKIIDAFSSLATLRQLCGGGDTDGAKALLDGLTGPDGEDMVEDGFSRYFANDPNWPGILESYPPLLEWRELKASLAEEDSK